jgi:hypothetical protein
MRIIDPTCTIGHLAKDPEISAAKLASWSSKGAEICNDSKLWRLYSGDEPCSKMITATVMEASAWNKNARAFAGWQASLGRVALPIFDLREEDDPEKTSMWKITFKEGGVEDVELVCAETKAEARRQFDKMARVTWVVKSIDNMEKKQVNINQ